MIGKLKILFRIKDLQQRRGWIATVIGADLVNLIHHKNRIIGFYRFQTLQNSAGHGTYIGTTMSTNLSFITHTTQREAIELASHGTGNGFAKGGFTNTGRTHKTDDGSLGFVIQFTNGKVFKNTLFYLI